MWWSDKKMKVFISWSGDLSLKVAKVLKEWIPCVIQGIEPYFSTEDIDKGARWSSDISTELEDANFGILCVTKDNLDSSWLNFEAGALSKAMKKSRVCPFLFDLKPSDISDNPILQFQMTNVDRDDVYKLFKSMNNALESEGLDEARLQKMFELSWPSIDKALKSIDNEKTDNSKKKSSNQNAIMEEMLDLLRSQQIILRNPEKLLPINYLSEAVSNKNYISSKISIRMLRNWELMRERLISDSQFSENIFIQDFIQATTFIFNRMGLPIKDVASYMPKFRINYEDDSSKHDSQT